MEHTDVVTIMERTLNYIDSRLLNHGRRVAYIVYQLLRSQGGYSERELRDICLAALLHDIGAYKTEEVDRMISFETHDTWDHSIYGYLFIKHFSPLTHLADPILYHHAGCAVVDRSQPHWKLSQIFFIADRLDVYAQLGVTDKATLFTQLQAGRDTRFFPEILDLVQESDLQLPVTDDDIVGDSRINQVLHGIPLTDSEVEDYLKMIVLFIDFRSHQTLTHTIATASISESIAEFMGLDEAVRQRLIAGAWLHDIGKTGIPLQILEKPDRLTPDEMAAIQRHVSLTDDILRGCVADDVRHIAARHHEKLDGSGYPRGLGADALTTCERIVVVADIFSALCGVRSYKDAFPKERVVSILAEMRRSGLVDPVVTDTAVAQYDAIVERMVRDARPLEESFEMISREFTLLQNTLEPLGRQAKPTYQTV